MLLFLLKIKLRNSLTDENFKKGNQPILNSNNVIVGPRCIPLTSKNIEANPYHPDLLSIPGAHIRNGFGLPILRNQRDGSDMPKTKCPDDSPCMMSVFNSFTNTVSKGFSISLSESKSFGNFSSSSKTVGSSNSYSKSIGNTLDNAVLESISVRDTASFSEQMTSSISNAHQNSMDYLKTKYEQNSKTNTSSEENEETNTVDIDEGLSLIISEDDINSSSNRNSEIDSKGKSTEKEHTIVNSISVKASVCVSVLVIFKTCASYTNTNTFKDTFGETTNQQETNEIDRSHEESKNLGSSNTKGSSKGKSNSIALVQGISNSLTRAHSSSSTENIRVFDSVSVSRDAARTNTNSKSTQNENSKTITDSYRVDDTNTSLRKNSQNQMGDIVYKDYNVSLSDSGNITVFNNKNKSIVYNKNWLNFNFETEIDDPKNLKLIVPIYFYPQFEDSNWNRVASVAQKIKTIAIVGDKNEKSIDIKDNPNYYREIKKLKNAGVEIIGHVNTKERNNNQIKRDIKSYFGWDIQIRPNGIFLKGQIENLKDLQEYVANNFGKDAKVISADPEVISADPKVINGKANVNYISENFKMSIQPKGIAKISLIKNFKEEDFEKDIEKLIENFQASNINYIYLTDGSNFESLSSYFDKEIEILASKQKKISKF